jgi:hypothetical protein
MAESSLVKAEIEELKCQIATDMREKKSSPSSSHANQAVTYRKQL